MLRLREAKIPVLFGFLLIAVYQIVLGKVSYTWKSTLECWD